MAKRKSPTPKPSSWHYPAIIIIGFVAFLMGAVLSALPIHAANLIQSASATRTTAQTNPTIVTATYPTAATAGRLLIAVVAANGDTTINGPSGWTQIINESGTVSQGIFYKLASGGETSISASVSANPGSIGLHIYEYAGANSLGAVSSNTGTSNTPSSGSIATTQTNELVFTAIVIRANTTYTNTSWNNAGEGFTERRDFNTGGGARLAAYAGGDNLTNTAGTKSVTVATGASAAWRGQMVSFQTVEVDTIPPSAITDLAASNPTGSSIELAWTAPGDDGSSGTASAYDIRYSTSLIDEGSFASANEVAEEPIPSMAGTAQSMTVTGLSQNTTYYFAIKSSDEAPNTSPISNVPDLTTTEASTEDPGDATVNLYPENIVVHILPEACTTDPKIQLLLHAHNATHVKIGYLPDLSDASWEPFEVGVDRFANISWNLPEGDGEKTIYVQFKSPFYDLESEIHTASVRLDQSTFCRSPEEHAHVFETQGKIRAREISEACLADFAHAIIEPHIDGFVPEVKTLSPTETQFTFTEENNKVEIVIKRLDEETVSVEIHKQEGDKPQNIKLRVHAADRGAVHDMLLWRAVSAFKELPKKIDLSTIPQLCTSELVPHPHPGDLFQGTSSDVYFMGDDDKRHAFPNKDVFNSWFQTSTEIMTVADYQIAEIPLGENITLRPGKLVRVLNSLVLYVTDVGRKLRQIITEALMDSYRVRIDDVIYSLSPALVTNYKFGNPILSEHDPIIALLNETSTNINDLWPTSDESHEPLVHSSDIRDGRVILENNSIPTGNTELRFRVLDHTKTIFTPDGLASSHGADVHVLIVREDLGAFQHLHPEERNGVWTVHAHFEEEGHYYLYTDIVPKGQPSIILRAPLAVGDNPLNNTSFPDPDPNQGGNDNPYRLELLTKELSAGKQSLLKFQLTKDGVLVSKIEPWLEAFAHLVIFKHGDWNTYIHTHPLEGFSPPNGQLHFIARFPTAGRYTLFTQIRVDDGVKTFPITIDIAE